MGQTRVRPRRYGRRAGLTFRLNIKGCRCSHPEQGPAFSSQLAVKIDACMHICHESDLYGASSPIVIGKTGIVTPEGQEARSDDWHQTCDE